MKEKNSLFKLIFNENNREKYKYVLSIILYVIGMLSSVIPYISVYKISELFLAHANPEKEGAVFWIIVAGVGILTNVLFTFMGSIGSHLVTFKAIYQLRLRILEHMGSLPMGFFTENPSGKLQKIIDENMGKIENLLAHIIPDMVGLLFLLISLFVFIGYLNSLLALTVILVIAFSLITQYSIWRNEKAKKLYSEFTESSANITSRFSEFIHGIAEVKLFGKTGKVTNSLEKSIDDYGYWELNSYKTAMVHMSLSKAIILSLLSFILPVGGILILRNPISASVLDILMALIIVPAIYDPLLSCFEYGAKLSLTKISAQEIKDLLSKETIRTDYDHSTIDNNKVVFNYVSFSYGSEDDPLRQKVLNNVSFSCEENSVTALVGESGSGKSTLGKLLLRFWDVQEGEIRVGGKDIRSIEPNDLMNRVSSVFQDTYIFSDTIFYNITMNDSYSKEEVESAARKARCHDFIIKLPQGYQTKVGSGNTKLSGGEAQRIAIARAFLKDAPILLLDEVTANIDPENESLIQEAIQTLTRNKTVITIAHRLKSIKNADKIVVLKDGEIIEQGKHEGLLEKSLEYSELWTLQDEADNWAITRIGGEKI